jgi:hypothetical protein
MAADIKVRLRRAAITSSPSPDTSQAASEEPDTMTDNASAQDANTRSNATPTETCHFFSIAAELRNEIYRLVFTTTADTNEEIDLLTSTAHLPSKSLHLACRQLHSEAALLYKDSCCRFWTNGRFVIRKQWRVDITPLVKNLPAQSLENITKLEIIHPCSSRTVGRFFWHQFEYGGNQLWTCTGYLAGPEMKDKTATSSVERILFFSKPGLESWYWMAADDSVRRPQDDGYNPVSSLTEQIQFLCDPKL